MTGLAGGTFRGPRCAFAWERADRQNPVETPRALWHPVHDCEIGRGHGGAHQCRCEAIAPADAEQDPRIPPVLRIGRLA